MAKKIFMPEATKEDRLRILRDNHESEVTTYYKELTQEEMDIRREQLADNSISLFDLGQQLADVKSDFKAKMEPLVIKNKGIMQELKTGQAECKGELFYVADQEASMMEVYDAEGELVSSRRLRPEEKQSRMSFLRPAANDQ